MKVGNFSASKASKTLGTAAGVVSGMVLSNGISSVVPLENKTASKAVVALVGVATAVLASGSDSLAKTARNVGIGMAAQQVKEIVKEVVAPHLPDNDFIKESFEQTTSVSTTEARAALNARRKRRMASPMPYRMGSPAKGFIAG